MHAIGRAIAATSVFFLVGLLLAGCARMIERLIFFPDPYVGSPPPGVAERWMTAADGTRIHGWHASPAKPIASLVWSHGNGGNIDGRGEFLVALAGRGFDVLAYDYRGYGKSEGHPSEAGVYLDAEAAFDSVVASGVPASRIVCFGESLGSAVSIRLASRRPCAAVAVVSSFTSLTEVARFHYGPLGRFAGARFDSLSLITGLSVPFFAAHGDRDEIVPFELGERLFAAAHPPKQFLRVAGAHHNDIFAHAAVLDGIEAFVRAHAAGEAS